MIIKGGLLELLYRRVTLLAHWTHVDKMQGDPAYRAEWLATHKSGAFGSERIAPLTPP